MSLETTPGISDEAMRQARLLDPHATPDQVADIARAIIAKQQKEADAAHGDRKGGKDDNPGDATADIVIGDVTFSRQLINRTVQQVEKTLANNELFNKNVPLKDRPAAAKNVGKVVALAAMIGVAHDAKSHPGENIEGETKSKADKETQVVLSLALNDPTLANEAAHGRFRGDHLDSLADASCGGKNFQCRMNLREAVIHEGFEVTPGPSSRNLNNDMSPAIISGGAFEAQEQSLKKFALKIKTAVANTM